MLANYSNTAEFAQAQYESFKDSSFYNKIKISDIEGFDYGFMHS